MEEREEMLDGWEPSRAQIWRRDRISEAIAAARSELAELAVIEALASVDRRLRGRRSPGLRAELARYALTVAGLELAAGAGPSQLERVRALFTEATRSLRRVGIGRKGSRLSVLHEELEIAARSVTSGAWAIDPDQGPSGALRDLLDGGPEVCLRLLEDRLLAAKGGGDRSALQLACVRVLRFGGRLEEAGRRLELVTGDAWADARAWEALGIDAMRAGSPASLLRALRAGLVARTAERMLELSLWVRACATKAHLSDLPVPSSLRRTADGGEAAAWQTALVLERAYKASLPLSARVASVRRAVDQIDAIKDVGLLMLSVAACARWFGRFKQPAESARAIRCYRALCLSTSDGASADVFAFGFAEPTDDPRAPASEKDDTSVWRMALELVKAKARSLGTGGDALEDYAEVLAFHMSALKGPIMKVGQVLSFYGAPLPDESLRLFAALQDDAAAVPFSTIRGVVEAELRQSAGDVFAFIDPAPLSTGSIGQVHRALRRTGEAVVVKVQLPGIAERIERDFRALRILLPLAASFFPGWDLAGILDELRARMAIECDYAAEARAQTAFRERLRDDPELVVPRVHEDLSTARILVSDLFDGQTFAEFARSADQAARDRAGDAIVRYAIRTTVVDRSFNTDMHPGNLLFSKDAVGLVDFGSVRTWTEASAHGWRELLRGMLAEDRAHVERALKLLEILPPARAGSFTQLYEAMTALLMGVLHSEGRVRVSKEALLAEMLHFSPSARAFARDLRVPPAYAYAFRMYWGMFAVLADLGAEVRFREITVDALARYSSIPTASRGLGA